MSRWSGGLAASDPTITVDKVHEWWDAVPNGWKLAVLALAVVLVVVGLVKRMVALTLVAALIGGALLAWWWWVSRT